jgi:DNA (cytosine-5)-methyltransferase 1
MFYKFIANPLKLSEHQNILKLLEDKGYVFVNSKNSAGINGLYRIYLPNSNIFPTLTATGTKDVVALKTIEAKNPDEFKQKFIEEIIKPKKYRPITAREAGKLQGFPDSFAIHKSERFAHKQFGNAVSTAVVYGVAKNLTGTFFR